MKSSTRRDACARGNCTKGDNAGAGSACPVHRRRPLHLGMGQFSLLPPPFGASPSRLDRQGLAASTGATPAQPAGAGRLDRREDGPTGKPVPVEPSRPQLDRHGEAGRTWDRKVRPARARRLDRPPAGSAATGRARQPGPCHAPAGASPIRGNATQLRSLCTALVINHIKNAPTTAEATCVRRLGGGRAHMRQLSGLVFLQRRPGLRRELPLVGFPLLPSVVASTKGEPTLVRHPIQRSTPTCRRHKPMGDSSRGKRARST